MWWGRHCHLGHRGGNRPGKFQELSPSLPDGRQLIWIQWWIWNGPHQGSLTSQAMPRFAQCWGVLRKAALTACAPEELLEIPLISTGKSAQVGPLQQSCSKEPWVGGGVCLCLGGSSICWYFVNSWLLHIHPPTGFPEKKTPKYLGWTGEWVTDDRGKKKKKVKKFCNMLLFKSKKKNCPLPCSGFSLVSLSCLSCETFCCLHFHSSQWKKWGKRVMLKV